MQWNSPLVHNGMPKGTINSSCSSIGNGVSCLHDWLLFANAINYSQLSQLIALRNLINPTTTAEDLILELILTMLSQQHIHEWEGLLYKIDCVTSCLWWRGWVNSVIPHFDPAVQYTRYILSQLSLIFHRKNSITFFKSYFSSWFFISPVNLNFFSTCICDQVQAQVKAPKFWKLIIKVNRLASLNGCKKIFHSCSKCDGLLPDRAKLNKQSFIYTLQLDDYNNLVVCA